MAMQQRPIIVSQAGLIINLIFPYLGACGILEIKCSYKYCDVDPCEAAGNKDFCSELTGGTLTLNQIRGLAPGSGVTL